MCNSYFNHTDGTFSAKAEDGFSTLKIILKIDKILP